MGMAANPNVCVVWSVCGSVSCVRLYCQKTEPLLYLWGWCDRAAGGWPGAREGATHVSRYGYYVYAVRQTETAMREPACGCRVYGCRARRRTM